MSEQDSAASEIVEQFEADHHYERVNHPARQGVVAVFAVPDLFADHTGYTVVTEAGETFTVNPYGDQCDCGDNSSYSARMGTAVKTAARKRESANCRHANIARSCERYGECDECGHRGFDSKKHTDRIGNVILVEDFCANCGEYLGC